MKEISLTQGKVALVDDADYEWLNQWKWYASSIQSSYSCRFYAKRRVRKGVLEYMHRLILELQRNDNREVDHIDGNGLNNQRSNLRVCTHKQNRQSSRKRKIGASRYKGVCWNRRRHKWCSYIYVNEKLIHLGYFDSETDAALAYNHAALNHFGKFALLNTL